MPTPAESRKPWELADSRGRPITRDRAVFAFWALAAMTAVCWGMAIWATRDALAGSLSAAQLLMLVPIWVICAGGIYLLWRLARFARKLPKSQRPS
jgi:DNA-binding transcriptional LysR family regulator